ncbi:MAG: hypothetical protein ACRD4S_02775 [Candidatus Acidiferrales bacterium]
MLSSTRASNALAQDKPGTPNEEVVANLAAGQVVIAVVKDAILIGAIENPIEPETRVPAPTPMGGRRAGVILGADEWFSPSSQLDLALFDQELPHLRPRVAGVSANPHLQQPQAGAVAGDIETIGQGVLDRLNQVASMLHGKIDLPPAEPITEVILADYLEDYGPEVWQLTYSITQEEETAGYWNTRVGRPVYLQIWPPEKGQPRTLMEFSYPPDNPPPSLLDLLRQNDPRIEKIRSSDAKMEEVAAKLLRGESTKIDSVDATQFLRAALTAIAPPHVRQAMGMIGKESGFEWILKPPPEKTKRRLHTERPAGAPTLIHP